MTNPLLLPPAADRAALVAAYHAAAFATPDEQEVAAAALLAAFPDHPGAWCEPDPAGTGGVMLLSDDGSLLVAADGAVWALAS